MICINLCGFVLLMSFPYEIVQTCVCSAALFLCKAEFMTGRTIEMIDKLGTNPKSNHCGASFIYQPTRNLGKTNTPYPVHTSTRITSGVCWILLDAISSIASSFFWQLNHVSCLSNGQMGILLLGLLLVKCHN